MTDSFARRLTDARPADGGLLLLWMGQSSVALRGRDALVLIDPWLSTELEETAGVTRAVPPPLRPAEVRAADLVLVTHEHPDHLDAVTLRAIAEQVPDASFVAPAPAVALLEAAGVAAQRIRAARPSMALEVAGVRVMPLPAAHELVADTIGGYRFWLDARGDHRALSYVVELDGRRVFHAGDGVWWPGLEDALRELAPELALLPINGRDTMRERDDVWGNLSAAEAAALCGAAGLRAVVPCHFDGVAGNLGDPAAFLRELAERAPGAVARVLHPGDELELPLE